MKTFVVKIRKTENYDEIRDNLDYWVSRSSEERVAAVDYLRNQAHGNTIRFQRTARVIQLSQS
jgi:hypothetical protein